MPTIGLAPEDRDYALMNRLELAIYREAGGKARFRQQIPRLFRQAIDEVVDTARSNRFTLDEIEKTEKTYIATKIEILLRNFLRMRKGIVLDLNVDGIDVDIKNTIARNWTIPPEAVGHPCILLRADESTALCCFEMIVIRDEILNPGRNQDRKLGISRTGLRHIHWLLKDEPYPENFWLNLAPQIRKEITEPRGGTDRVAALFRKIQRKPIS